MAKWQIQKNGKEHGPFDSSQLKQLAKSGQLSPDDFVRRDDMPKWSKASKVQGLFPSESKPAPAQAAAPAPPPPMPSASSPPLEPPSVTLAPSSPFQTPSPSTSVPVAEAVSSEDTTEQFVYIWHSVPAILAGLTCCCPVGLGLVWTHPLWTIQTKGIWTLCTLFPFFFLIPNLTRTDHSTPVPSPPPRHVVNEEPLKPAMQQPAVDEQRAIFDVPPIKPAVKQPTVILEQAVNEGDRLWGAGKKSEAATQYRAVISQSLNTIPENRRSELLERVVLQDYEAEEMKGAHDLIQSAKNQGLIFKPTFLTDDFYPFIPGSKRQFLGQVGLGGGKRIHSRKEIEHTPDREIRITSLSEFVTSEFGTTANIQMPLSDPVINQYRLRGRFIEIGHQFDGNGPLFWDAWIKLGAKKGDTWSYDENGIHRVFRCLDFGEQKTGTHGVLYSVMVQSSATSKDVRGKDTVLPVSERRFGFGVGPITLDVYDELPPNGKILRTEWLTRNLNDKITNSPPNARRLMASVAKVSSNDLYDTRCKAITSINCYATKSTLVVDLTVDHRKWPPINAGLKMIVRLFDENGQYLTHFTTEERYTAEARMAEVGRKVPSVGRNLVRLIEEGNRLEYPINVRDLRDVAAVEIGFLDYFKGGK